MRHTPFSLHYNMIKVHHQQDRASLGYNQVDKHSSSPIQ
jgi:hypothetical protein